MIKPIQQSDVNQAIRLAASFWDEANWESYFDGPLELDHLERNIRSGLVEKRVVGWASYEDPTKMNAVFIAVKDVLIWKNVTTLKEIAWYAQPTYRGNMASIKLYKEAEKYACENNISAIIMSRVTGMPEAFDKLGRFYEKQGYSILENQHIKKIK